MRPRTVLLLLSGPVLVAAPAGCGGTGTSPPAPASAPAASAPSAASLPRVQLQPVSAEQLAQILGVTVWTAKFSGGPIQCWLDIEEEGQETLPKRIPAKGFLGDSASNPPSEGTIELWWTRREDRLGGLLHAKASNGAYSYGLGKDAFTFAWSSFSSRATTVGENGSTAAPPGREFALIDYEAIEGPPADPAKAPRRVHLRLMGRFAEPGVKPPG